MVQGELLTPSAMPISTEWNAMPVSSTCTCACSPLSTNCKDRGPETAFISFRGLFQQVPQRHARRAATALDHAWGMQHAQTGKPATPASVR